MIDQLQFLLQTQRNVQCLNIMHVNSQMIP
jgi:hypothetical protein